jgi:hypothetical protein
LKYTVKHSEQPKEYKRQQTAESRRQNPIRYLLNQVRYRCRKTGQEFSITQKDLEVPSVCPVFNIPLFFTPGRRSKNSFSLDRKDNSKGYTKANTRVISFWANQMKGDMTIEQVEALLKYMKGE